MKKAIAALLLTCLTSLCLTGCQKNIDSAAVKTGLAVYMSSVETQSTALKASLEKSPLTQTDLNEKSGKLRDLWEAAMNSMLEEAKKALPAAEMENLTAGQEVWLTSTEKAVEAAGKEFEGGSMYALVTNMEAASLAEARACEIYELLK